MHRFSYLFILCFASSLSLTAQFYNTGTAPASVRWMQINTKNFQLIYPSELYVTANRTANILEAIYEVTARDYRNEPKKISVILHNRSVLSNGYVTWAPRRMEWITTPPEENQPLDYITHLAIHENRHVVQIHNLNQGFTRIYYFLLGEAAVGAMAAYLPLWFMEGDAVLAETALSPSGRGRMARFDYELRAIELDGSRRYSYDQAYLGSYKHHTPSHYHYGYQMTSYAHLKYGSEFWGTTLNTVARRPLTLVPFYRGLRKGDVISKESLYEATFDSLKTQWQRKTFPHKEESYLYTRPTKHYTEYRYVQPYRDGFFAVRSGINDLTRFVYLKDSTEKVIHTPGLYSKSRPDVGKRYIAWAEYQPDLRWEQQSFSNIKLLDSTTYWPIPTRLEARTRRFAPVLHPDESLLACISIDLENRSSIQILSLPDGEVLQEFPFPVGQELYSPVWMDSGNLACILLDSTGKSIIEIDIADGSHKPLFHAGRVNIDRLASADTLLLFAYDKQMATNIYGLNLNSGSLHAISQARHSADYSSYAPATNEILYSSYTTSGYKPVLKSLEELPKPVHEANYQRPWAEALTRQSGFDTSRLTRIESTYSEKPYRKLWHGINIHSWAPFYVDPDISVPGLANASPGVMLFSQNKLSSVTGILAYQYLNNTHYLEPHISFQGWYPVFDLSARFSSRPLFADSQYSQLPDHLERGYSLRLRSYLPLNFTRNKYQRRIQPEISYWYTHYYYNQQNRTVLGGDFLNYRLTAYNLLKRSQRDIEYRFGQVLQMGYNHSLSTWKLFPAGNFLTARLYLPGLFLHHTLSLSGAWENMQYDDRELFLGNRIALPRGYTETYTYNSISKFSIEYTLPLFYPDWSLGPLIYFKRFHLKAFYEHAGTTPRNHRLGLLAYREFLSTGIILGSEVHILRFFAPLSPQLLLAYIPNEGNLHIRFTMGVDIVQ